MTPLDLCNPFVQMSCKCTEKKTHIFFANKNFLCKFFSHQKKMPFIWPRDILAIIHIYVDDFTLFDLLIQVWCALVINNHSPSGIYNYQFDNTSYKLLCGKSSFYLRISGFTHSFMLPKTQKKFFNWTAFQDLLEDKFLTCELKKIKLPLSGDMPIFSSPLLPFLLAVCKWNEVSKELANKICETQWDSF